METISQGKRSILSKNELNNFDVQIEVLGKILEIYKKCYKMSREIKAKCVRHADFLLELLLKLRNKMSLQIIDDFSLEFLRFGKMIEMCILESHSNCKQVLATNEGKCLYSDISNELNCCQKYSHEQDNILKALFVKFGILIDKSYTLSPEEKKMIVKAMGMAAGHWFKCPNGHTYCITECGGAMVESKCNECGAKIGGSQHRLRTDNAHDGSMDGSQFAAWSDTANMRNYNLD